MMKFEMTYDAKLDAWTLTHRDVRLQSLADVREWERGVRDLMEKVTEPISLLIDLTNFFVAPEMGPEFGSLIKGFVMPRTRALLRYGQVDEMTRMAIQLQATVNRFPLNLYPDRESAVQALAQLRTSA